MFHSPQGDDGEVSLELDPNEGGMEMKWKQKKQIRPAGRWISAGLELYYLFII